MVSSFLSSYWIIETLYAKCFCFVHVDQKFGQNKDQMQSLLAPSYVLHVNNGN